MGMHNRMQTDVASPTDRATDGIRDAHQAWDMGP